MKHIFATQRWIAILVASVLLAAVSLAQAPAKKPLTFKGKVESVDATAKSVKVNGEKVEGWMMAMTMDYKVDDPSILAKLKTGDQIMATVYEGDMVLHKVMVLPKEDNMKPKK